VFGAAINTPGDTIRTVIQKRMLGNQPGAVGFFAVAQEIAKTRGAGALYAGFNFKALHLGGGGALMAFFLPFFKKVFAVPH
jgi:Mitochondrial carrier protein